MHLEVLIWKVDLEEPTAASAISQALSTGHQLALRTSELTAVVVLTGEIIVQLPMHLGERVAFQTVRDRVRRQLDDAVDDPDLPAVYDYLIYAVCDTIRTQMTFWTVQASSSIPKSDVSASLRSETPMQFASKLSG